MFPSKQLLNVHQNLYKVFPTLHVLSKLGFLFSCLLILPALISLAYNDGLIETFLISGVLAASACLFIWGVTKRFEQELKPREGFTLVFAMWMGFALVASLPFYLHLPKMGFTDAFFEAMSGLTTTGATAITNLDALPPSLNFWRHFLIWIGGMGIIVLAVAILPMLGVGGMQLYKAEMPGLNKDTKLAPRITQTAKHLWVIYFALTIICFLALKIAGMSWLDAICHAFSTLGLGGVSSHNEGIAYFDSIPIELIISLFTIIGGINFANHFFAVRQKSFKIYAKDLETRVLLIILLGSCVLMSLFLWLDGFYGFWASIRYVFFTFISFGLASGFSNTNFAEWPLAVSLWMFLLANFLASSGSTGGGIKMVRAIILFKYAIREMTLLLHPHAVRTVKINQRLIPEHTALAVMAFIFVYFSTIVIFTFAMMFTGFDFMSAFTAIIASITNTGTGLGAVGPSGSFATLSALQKWICLSVMLLGRLEIFTILILFTPAYWRK
ncbi:TrkH family potassium uptake protein [Neisseriaceae bacterium CLB008]|nr:TrkH family potassium uptake protein [Neisseriaceae bacterium]